MEGNALKRTWEKGQSEVVVDLTMSGLVNRSDSALHADQVQNFDDFRDFQETQYYQGQQNEKVPVQCTTTAAIPNKTDLETKALSCHRTLWPLCGRTSTCNSAVLFRRSKTGTH